MLEVSPSSAVAFLYHAFGATRAEADHVDLHIGVRHREQICCSTGQIRWKADRFLAIVSQKTFLACIYMYACMCDISLKLLLIPLLVLLQSLLLSTRMTTTMATRKYYQLVFFSLVLLQAEHLVISSGCAAILVQLSMLLFNAGDSVLVPAPYYPAFDHDFRNFGQGQLFELSTITYVYICMHVCMHVCMYV